MELYLEIMKTLVTIFVICYVLFIPAVAIVLTVDPMPRWEWRRKTFIYPARISLAVTIMTAIMMEIK